MIPRLRTGESATLVNFGNEIDLVVPILLGKTCIDRFIKSIHLAQRKLVPHHSPPVPILMADQTMSVAEMKRSDFHQQAEKYLALLLKSTSCQSKYVTIARQVVLKKMREKPVLFITQSAALIEIFTHENVASNNAGQTPKAIMDVQLGHQSISSSQSLASLMLICPSSRMFIKSRVPHSKQLNIK